MRIVEITGDREAARQEARALATASTENQRIVNLLYTALPQGHPDHDYMTEMVSEDIERIKATETHPVVIAELITVALRAIAHQCNVAI